MNTLERTGKTDGWRVNKIRYTNEPEVIDKGHWIRRARRCHREEWVSEEKASGSLIHNYIIINTFLVNHFRDLTQNWKKETGHLSTTIHITRNENYLKIIAMGPQVVPLIIHEMQREPDEWFVALRLLTNQNPVKKENLGDIDGMTEDWINWSKGHK